MVGSSILPVLLLQDYGLLTELEAAMSEGGEEGGDIGGSGVHPQGTPGIKGINAMSCISQLAIVCPT